MLIEEKIANLIKNTISNLGFELVQVSLGNQDKRKILTILIDGVGDKKITASDCSLVSRNISALLDVEDIIPGKYFLEVSSAGVERPLISISDYKKFTGYDIKLQLKDMFNGKLKYKGKIIDVLGEGENIKILLKSKNLEVQIDFANIKKANLLLTDELFRQLLNKK